MPSRRPERRTRASGTSAKCGASCQTGYQKSLGLGRLTYLVIQLITVSYTRSAFVVVSRIGAGSGQRSRRYRYQIPCCIGGFTVLGNDTLLHLGRLFPSDKSPTPPLLGLAAFQPCSLSASQPRNLATMSSDSPVPLFDPAIFDDLKSQIEEESRVRDVLAQIVQRLDRAVAVAQGLLSRVHSTQRSRCSSKKSVYSPSRRAP